MTRDKLHEELKIGTKKLIEMALDLTWNTISGNCNYILSRINDSDGHNTSELRRIRKSDNEKRTPKALNEIVLELECIYSDLYDVNLVIYKAGSKRTIVEIQYYAKSSLSPEYGATATNQEPMLHCKVPIPPYLKKKDQSFDVNWELGGLRYVWNMFWWKMRSGKSYLSNDKYLKINN